MNIKPILFGLSGLAVLSLSSTAQAFTWKSESASAQGTGCNSLPASGAVDVYFLSNGPDLSIVFTSLGIELVDPSQGLNARKNCNLRVPFLLSSGSFEGQLSETVTIGLTKTEGSDAQVDFKSRVIDSLTGQGAFNPMNNRFNRGQVVNEPLLVRQRETVMGVGPGRRCQFSRTASNANKPFFYDAQMALSASRQDLNQQVVLTSDAVDIRLELSQKVEPCINGRPPTFPGGGIGGVPGTGPGPRPPRPTPRPQPTPLPPPPPPPNQLAMCSAQFQVAGSRGGVGMGQPGERLYGYAHVPQLANAVDFQVTYTEYHSHQNVDPYNVQVHAGNQSAVVALGNSGSQWISLQPGTTQVGLSTLINQRPGGAASSQNFTLNVRISFRKMGGCF